ncbi:trypsin-3 isoform X2 [Pangasianodon hypophthalmus]|uniref:trypsin-3 isoform X2 n=1 Tax=Pangasianodon hypophthalmus TaxID=310915 RepID=UPI00230761F0|nr:trypsin-3 isoform X2 [Pangasianodon hypophthalmus]
MALFCFLPGVDSYTRTGCRSKPSYNPAAEIQQSRQHKEASAGQDFFQSQRASDYAKSPHSVKYIVSLQTSKGQHFCAGTLVHKYWVLTAAHCNTGVDQMMIVAGDNFLGKYEGMEQYSKPYSITPHPLYNKSTSNADIMLIKLRAPIKLNRYVSLAPLPKQNTGVLPGRLCQVYDWSPTRQGRGVSLLTLHSVTLPITSTAKCNSSRSYNGSITSNMICAGYSTGGKDACKWDAGELLVCDGRLYGFASWGNIRRVTGLPGVYTAVARFRRWIDRTIYRSFTRCYKYRNPLASKSTSSDV